MSIGTTIDTDDGLAATLVRQRAAFLRDGPPPLAERRSDLMRLKNALRAHREDFVAAINTCASGCIATRSSRGGGNFGAA